MGGRIASCVACIVLAQHGALAQEANASADALFRQGRDLMAAGKYAEACDAFAASEKADAAVTTLLNLADCREKNNQLATAWALFLDAERQTRDGKDDAAQRYHQTAADHAAKLEPTLSKLAIDVPNQAAGLTITRAGQPIDPALWNHSLPIDGGSYKIVATAPGYLPWSSTIEVAPSGDSKTVEVPALKPAATTPEAPPPPAPVAEHHRSPAQLASLALIGVGGASTVAGLVVGALARSKWHDAQAVCGPSLECDSDADLKRAHSLADSAHSRGNLATGLVVGGLVAAAAGVALHFVGHEHEEPVAIEPVLDPSQIGVAVHARF